MVRLHPLQPAKRQARRRHRADHAPPAREPALGRHPRDDPAGHVLAQEPCEVVRPPAIAEDDERHRVETVFVVAVQLLSGTRCTVAADRTVEMSEADAAPLLRAGWTRADNRNQPQ
jgi:hypothetical protein